ncbi:MAG: 50S ribosome-binding GTPase, partial [Gemmatimonadetes bacterium]|nr:50S ribosome-binding GTPase [Gemmatimonadota bacterium]
NRLFATLDTLTRETTLNGGKNDGKRETGKGKRRAASEPRSAEPPNRRVRLVDTVGFIRKLPHHLVASFRTTLEEVRRADVLLHVIDAAHPDWDEQVEVVNRTLADLGVQDAAPVVHVFNKMDLVPEPEALRATLKARYERVACVSAEKGEVQELVRVLSS